MHPLVRPITLVLPLWLIACSSTPVATAPATDGTAVPSSPQTAVATTDAAPSAASRSDVASSSLGSDAALGRERSVYFEFDDTAVRGEYAPLIQRHGQYLQSHPSMKVVVQGNTDERGGSEYNLALGQRRAEAVRAALRVYGVRDAQVEAVSFGEERPQADGHDEGAWRQNRRADIVYPR
jgi:peptidoglycan-associated lipoprotein